MSNFPIFQMTPTATAARRQFSHLARPLDHHAQGPNIPFGVNPSLRFFFFHMRDLSYGALLRLSQPGSLEEAFIFLTIDSHINVVLINLQTSDSAPVLCGPRGNPMWFARVPSCLIHHLKMLFWPSNLNLWNVDLHIDRAGHDGACDFRQHKTTFRVLSLGALTGIADWIPAGEIIWRPGGNM